LLEDNRVDITCENNYAIKTATRLGHHEMIDILQKKMNI